jgi:ribonuclease HI
MSEQNGFFANLNLHERREAEKNKVHICNNCNADIIGWSIGGKKNEDLWRRFLKSYHKFDIKFNWVKGHNGHPENERCDVLATMAADRN